LSNMQSVFLGKREEENGSRESIKNLPTDTEKGDKTHVKVLSVFPIDRPQQIFKKVHYLLSICAINFISVESKTVIIL